MKIAIHHFKNSFSERWIEYCNKNKVDYKLVDCYASDIVEQVKDCDILMWHWHHADPKAVLFARQLTYSLEKMGKKVFPNANTCWHFDDKVGQKYLLEAIGAPMVPSYVFYDKTEALEWTKTTGFPKVFKLRGGAGAMNVSLALTKVKAKKLIKQAFGKGFSQFNSLANLKERFRKFREGKESILGVLKGIGRLFIKTKFAKMISNEKGYAYFQEFVPNNDSDIRVIVIGDRAFGLKRMCRKGDFRASGSGSIVYDKNQIDQRCVKLAFETSSKLNAQCLAYDFVFDQNNNPLIVEISYGFSMLSYDNCPGYWDKKLNWKQGKFNPQAWMIDNLLTKD